MKTPHPAAVYVFNKARPASTFYYFSRLHFLQITKFLGLYMGYYFIGSRSNSNDPWSIAILTKFGYSVMRHDKSKRLQQDVHETAEYMDAEQRIWRGHDASSTFGKTIAYPNQYISKTAAKAKHAQMFALEEIKHQQIIRRIQESDLVFSFKEAGVKSSNADVAYDVLSCFLQEKSEIGVEKVGSSLRIYHKPNMLKRLISNYGETLISISMGDIIEVNVGLQTISFTAKDRTSCGVGRNWFKSFQMVNGVFMA